MKSLQQKFDEKYMPEPNSGCWLWMGRINSDGYGQLRQPDQSAETDRRFMAHRLSWELHRGAITNGLRVLHKCDVPACVNPDHLFLGTQQDNVDDMVAKGRWRTGNVCGEINGQSVLTEVQALEILRSEERPTVLARRYGVSYKTIWQIKVGRRWGHLQ